jgi:hypothetical protein
MKKVFFLYYTLFCSALQFNLLRVFFFFKKKSNPLYCHEHFLFVWFQVKKLHQEKQLNMMVDKDLGSNYDRVELEEMVQVALLCTQYHPSHRPRMSEVIRMLEGDGLAEKWEASQNVDTPKSVSSEILPPKYMDFAADESSLGLEAMELSGPR